jgi:hypothetical protein
VFSTWLTKRVGGMVGGSQKRTGSVGGGGLAKWCYVTYENRWQNWERRTACIVEGSVFTLTASSHDLGSLQQLTGASHCTAAPFRITAHRKWLCVLLRDLTKPTRPVPESTA